MTDRTGPSELDVRGMRKPDKHPTIFATFRGLPVGGSFVLINDHDPVHLHNEFEADHSGSYGWEYLNREIRDFRIRITRITTTPLPRVLRSSGSSADASAATPTGAVWELGADERDLDASIVRLDPHQTIAPYAGPPVDALLHVLDGDGEVTTEQDTVVVATGDLVWLPRRSQRGVAAGSAGMRYLTVQQQRVALGLTVAPR